MTSMALKNLSFGLGAIIICEQINNCKRFLQTYI